MYSTIVQLILLITKSDLFFLFTCKRNFALCHLAGHYYSLYPLKGIEDKKGCLLFQILQYKNAFFDSNTIAAGYRS